MTEILLDDSFMWAVKMGFKKQTVRNGQRNYPLGSAILKSEFENIEIEITKVTYKKFININDAEVFADGFDNIVELYNVLKGFYPEFDTDSIITLVEFKMRNE